MTLGDLYLRMYNSQTILLYDNEKMFIDRFTIGTIPSEILNSQVVWITVDNSCNLEIYLN